MTNEQPRRAKRIHASGLPGDGYNNRTLQHIEDTSIQRPRRRLPRWLVHIGAKLAVPTLVGALFISVIWVGAELAYTAGQPIVAPVATLQAKRLPTGVPTVAPTWTPTTTPTPTPRATATPPSLPPVPKWFTETQMIRCAGIVSGEAGAIKNQDAWNFVATQIFYDYVKYKGKLPTSRWKGYEQPTHETLQACNIALMNYDAPIYPKCLYVGGLNDGDYFKRTTQGISMDYFCSEGGCRVVTDTTSLPAVDYAVVGWECK